LPRAAEKVIDLDTYRTGKAYTVGEVAHLVKTSPSTVRRWIKGYVYDAQGRRMAPVFGEKDVGDGSPPLLSYLDLIEILVAVRFTQHGGKLEKVRAAREMAKKKWPDLRYPFASVRLKMAGGDLLHGFDEEYGGAPLSMTLGTPEAPQYALPHIVEGALELLDFEGDLSVRWFPAGRDVPIVVDPRFAGGRPTIVKTGVTVDTIARRFVDGHEKMAYIARDLSIRTKDVEEAIRYAKAA